MRMALPFLFPSLQACLEPTCRVRRFVQLDRDHERLRHADVAQEDTNKRQKTKRTDDTRNNFLAQEGTSSRESGMKLLRWCSPRRCMRSPVSLLDWQGYVFFKGWEEEKCLWIVRSEDC